MLTSPSGKSYIGQTTRSIKERFTEHQYSGSNCIALHGAIHKYGWDNIEKDWYECPDEDLDIDEELLVREVGTLSPGGYNLKEGGGSSGKHSIETIQKISLALQGCKHPNYGKTFSDETKQKISKSQIGKKLSEKTKERMSIVRTGKNFSDETKQKISKSQIGKKLSEKTKQKLRDAHIGKTRSIESKKNGLIQYEVKRIATPKKYINMI
jgi:group I intron endonuclease